MCGREGWLVVFVNLTHYLSLADYFGKSITLDVVLQSGRFTQKKPLPQVLHPSETVFRSPPRRKNWSAGGLVQATQNLDAGSESTAGHLSSAMTCQRRNNPQKIRISANSRRQGKRCRKNRMIERGQAIWDGVSEILACVWWAVAIDSNALTRGSLSESIIKPRGSEECETSNVAQAFPLFDHYYFYCARLF